ncbi:MAG: hypothetical protein GWN92_07490, partial [candidate division Zixibacteria bacterium]|nr:hypothetical protein [candidate division Zixibacteria bacterium]
LLLLSLIFSLFSLTLSAQDIEYYNHPELEWQTIETEHFLVHYHQGTERTANVVAKIAEEVYPHITGLYQYKPASKTEFIIRDTEDYANGGAYFFDNKVEIWAENLDYVLRGTHNWLRDVVTHEYTHIISLQKALKFSRHVPAGWLQVFGYEEERRADVVRGFPDVLVSYPIAGLTIPAWFAEGVAQFQSSSKRYDYRDSHREMILRDRVMTGNLLSLDEMGTFGKNSIGNESSYNLGYALVNFLTENYGDTVVAKMAEKASAPFRLSFSDAMKSVTGVSAEELYRQWATHLKDTYTKRLNTITANERIGEAFVEKGIGNLYPTVSPSGKKIAYLTTADADYLSQNKLVVEDIQSGEKQIVAPKVTRSISWSPDNRYLAYAKVTPEENTASMYNDIYVYDLEEEKEYRLTRSLRARHPDWSHDGQKLTFVVESDGLTNLYVLELGNPHFAKSFNDTDWKDRCYHLNKHVIVNSEPDGLSGSEHLVYRDVGFKGVKLRQLTHFVNGRQIYHPRWAPDDSYIIFDTSIEFARDIAKIPAEGGEMSFVLKSPSDERYPIFHPNTGELFYADDQTGIFNIYSLDLETGESKAYTNVVGGAFMPSLTPDGDLYYSLYRDVGYKIHHIANADTIRMSKLTYLENYEKTIPRIEVNDKVSEPLSSKAYSFSFPGVSLMPRLLIDYGTVKPGLYASTNEILNKMLFFGGFDFNFRKDYNIFAIFNFNLFKPTFFIEAYNQSQNITDNVSLEGYTPEPEVDINFNLLEVDIGLEGHWLPWMFEGFYARLAYIFSFYRARINTFGFRDPASGRFFEFAPIRYDYLRGHSLSLFLRY